MSAQGTARAADLARAGDFVSTASPDAAAAEAAATEAEEGKEDSSALRVDHNDTLALALLFCCC